VVFIKPSLLRHSQTEHKKDWQFWRALHTNCADVWQFWSRMVRNKNRDV